MATIKARLRRVVPNDNWSSESLLRLLAGLMLCLMLGGAVNGLIQDPDLTWLRFVVGTLTFHGAALALVHWMLSDEQTGWSDAFGLRRGRLFAVVGVGALAAIMILPVAWLGSYGSAEVMRMFFVEPAPQPAVMTLRSSTEWWQTAAMGFMAVAVAPAAEEVLFRGLLYPMLKRRFGLGWAVVATSLMFAVIHLNLMTFIPLLLLAGVLVWLYEYTGNLLAPVSAHAIFNLANLLLMQVL
jgi:uncharacterized protein